MIKTLLGKVFGDRHEREARRLEPLVDEKNVQLFERYEASFYLMQDAADVETVSVSSPSGP